jgi:hypothetical protein
MESKRFLAVLMLLLVPLSGCLGFGDNGGDADPDEHADDCPDDAMDDAQGTQTGNGTGNETGNESAGGSLLDLPVLTMQSNETGNGTGNETMEPGAGGEDCPPTTTPPGDGNETPTPELPNELPVGVLRMFRADGAQLTSFEGIKVGETIRFSANGTADPDGSIDLIGLTIVDGNGSRTVQLLQDGAFVDATLSFSKVGPINATMRVLDNRGEGIVLYAASAVNEVKAGSEKTTAYAPTTVLGDDCRPAVDREEAIIVGNSFVAIPTFTVGAGAKYITVTASNTEAVTICTPGNDSLDSGESSAETSDELELGIGYKAVLYPDGADVTMAYTITVHYHDKAPA